VANQNKKITHKNRHTILCDSHEREGRPLHFVVTELVSDFCYINHYKFSKYKHL